ncbi:MAG: hypothetical protein H6621_01420 [Halobacteriovoraceae bacterium]|nr:hypothetical protein [Halobacteriovoraceae bacterium]
MRFKLNDNWLSDLYYMAQQAEGDEKKLYMKMHTEMMNEYKAGKRMSHTYSLETIVTEVKPNPEAVGFEFVFLANEGVASSGDIFMANVRNNQLGVIIGQRTMGAGGNVVGYSPLDFSHGYFRMTESLLYNKKIHGGKPIENLGVEPHLYVDTNINRANNFSEIIKVAQHFITDHGEYSSAMAHVQAFKAGLCNLFLRRSLH